jgi:hypothetical protein
MVGPARKTRVKARQISRVDLGQASTEDDAMNRTFSAERISRTDSRAGELEMKLRADTRTASPLDLSGYKPELPI